MKELVNNLDNHPIAAFLFSVLGIGAGTGLHYVHPLLQVGPHDHLDVTLKLFQIAAYAGGAMAGFVSFHGWIMKMRDRKKDKKGKK